MLFVKEGFRKKHTGRTLVSYRLTDGYAQLSYQKIGGKQPQTFSLVAGMEEYNLPLALYYRKEEKLWQIRKKAGNAAEEEALRGAVRVDGLLSLAVKGERVTLAGESYDPRALLALFVKKSLSLLNLETSLEQIAALVFVVDGPEEKQIEALREMAGFLPLKDALIQFMGKEESFFWYNLHTEPSLWRNDVLLVEWEKEGLGGYRLRINRDTTPMVTLVEKQDWEKQGKRLRELPEADRDREFLRFCLKEFQEPATAVYLIGDGFAGDWYPQSLRFLCGRARVFRGNNLYSKGGCQGLLQRLEPDRLGEAYVYLGEDKLAANVGMRLLRQGKESYLAILSGGCSWYEARREWEVLLEGENELTFSLTPLDGRAIAEHVMLLAGLNPEKQALARIRLEAVMEGKSRLVIRAWDRGFGSYYPSSGHRWEELIEW